MLSELAGPLPTPPLTDPTVQNYRSRFVGHDSPSSPSVGDARRQQGVAREEFDEARPREPAAARPASEPCTPDPAHHPMEPGETAVVRRAPVVLVVPTQHRVER